MTIVVTGSSTGIGRALTERLLARGDRVWGLARSPQPELAQRYPETFRFSPCDVSDWNQVDAAAHAIRQAWSRLDALVTCAGVQGAVGPAMSLDPEQWSATIRANLDGTYYAIRALYPLFQREAPARAKVVCFSGGGATKSRPHFSAYAAAKTGVVRLVETLAEELRGQPVDLNAVAPGAIATRLTDEVLALGAAVTGEAEYNTALKLKAAGSAPMEKAVGLVLFLLSPASDGISGRLISAPWDPWATLGSHASELAKSDVYTLRRIVPEERGLTF